MAWERNKGMPEEEEEDGEVELISMSLTPLVGLLVIQSKDKAICSVPKSKHACTPPRPQQTGFIMIATRVSYRTFSWGGGKCSAKDTCMSLRKFFWILGLLIIIMMYFLIVLYTLL